MPESSIVVRPVPAESDSYTPSTRLQAAGLKPAIGLFERIAATVPLPPAPQPIVIADYGAATGHNSLLPIGAAIAVLRGRTAADRAVLVAHTDLPGNDFTALFTTLAEDPDSYLLNDTASFPAAIGRSFYSQILPSQSVTLGWTSWATMWLSRPADELPEVLDHLQVAYSSNDAARSAYAHQAAKDWQDFVAFRSRELTSGGKLLVLTTSVDQDGQHGYRTLLDAIRAALEGQLPAGLVHPDEMRRMTVPMFFRSEQDFRAPFAPNDRFNGVSIEHLELFNAEDRFWSGFLTDHDATKYGAQWAALARAAIFPGLIEALDGGIADPRAADFVEHLEVAVAAQLARSPEPMQIPLALVVLAKNTDDTRPDPPTRLG